MRALEVEAASRRSPFELSPVPQSRDARAGSGA
jgi:hypothetical protein